MAYTTPTTRSVGEVITNSHWNTDVVENIKFLHDVAKCRVYNSANISLANNTETALTFNTERWDNDGIHSTSSNTSRLTCQTAGTYHISGTVSFAANATGWRLIRIKLGGTTNIASTGTTPLGVNDTNLAVNTDYELAVGNYVELIAYQSSGGALNVLASPNTSPEFSMTWLGG